jgi:hypothetical protein
MAWLAGLVEALIRQAREAKSDDPDSDVGEHALFEDMAADEEEEMEIEEEELGG